MIKLIKVFLVLKHIIIIMHQIFEPKNNFQVTTQLTVCSMLFYCSNVLLFAIKSTKVKTQIIHDGRKNSIYMYVVYFHKSV